MFPTVDIENNTVQSSGFDLVGGLSKLFRTALDSKPDGFIATIAHWWDIYSVVALLLALLFFIGFIYAKIRYGQLSDGEQAVLRAAEAAWQTRYGHEVTKNNRWADVEEHIAQNDPNAWKLAIIEADILLEETLASAGYVGTSIGDKLKTANPSAFTTVQDAWNAHKVRNQIAHEGGDFILTKKIAQDAIKQYERVFREFGVL